MSKRNIKCIEQEEPAFIRQFKQKIGYKEGPTLDSKRAGGPEDLGNDSGSEPEDEGPSIVVLKKGDLTAEEVQELKDKGQSVEFEVGEEIKEEEEEPPADGRIVFKKPKKRATDSDLSVSSKKKKEAERIAKKSSGKKVKNRSLLSFGDDEEED